MTSEQVKYKNMMVRSGMNAATFKAACEEAFVFELEQDNDGSQYDDPNYTKPKPTTPASWLYAAELVLATRGVK